MLLVAGLLAPARGIEGMSMGGYGALHFGMRHPALFGASSSVAPSILPDLKDKLSRRRRSGRVIHGSQHAAPVSVRSQARLPTTGASAGRPAT